MKKDPKIFLEHILQCIELIEEYMEGVTKKQFLESVQLQDSIIRRIEIMGEAIKNIPKQVKDRYTDIAWKEIAGMRDILIHEYFGVDLGLTWKVATKDVRRLKNRILKVKKDLENK
ncbi:MAG: DUF86 domain-containing protein [Sedimentisphaerales bacterium]|jgi:uncharacterized protein with HEPN domain